MSSLAKGKKRSKWSDGQVQSEDPSHDQVSWAIANQRKMAVSTIKYSIYNDIRYKSCVMVKVRSCCPIDVY